MGMTVQVRNADRMMTSAEPVEDGILLAFADGCTGLIPYADLPEIAGLADVADVEFPNPYELILKNPRGESSEIPWDFARHYCDETYRPRIEEVAARGRRALGARIRDLRREAGVTQEGLARAAGVGRVTLVRVERGAQSPRFDTLVALARGLDREVGELVGGEGR